MVFRRKGRKTYEFQAVQRDGRFRLTSSGTTNKALGGHIEGMWNRLARTHRAFDLLERVGRELTIGELYDHWEAAKQQVEEVRRRLDDRNVEAEVASWSARYAADYPDAAMRALDHVRWLLPVGEPRPVSAVTPDWLREQLYAYTDHDGKSVARNTRRKIHAHWSVFFDHCVKAGLFPVSPMSLVDRPPKQERPIRFHDQATAERIVAAQPTGFRRCLFALAYGAAIEASPLVALHRRDVDVAAHEVRVHGTKAVTRHRVCLIADWAWPHVEAHIRHMLPDAPLFPGLHRSTVSHWHLGTERTLKIPELRLHEARHHWAVRMLRIGTPVAVVQHQLGHGNADITLRVYGPFMPDGADRRAWEAKASKAAAKRAKATGE